MGKKIKKIIKDSKLVLKSIKPIKQSEVPKRKELRLFFWFMGHKSVSMTLWDDDSRVIWDGEVSQRKDGFIHLSDIEYVRNDLHEFEKLNNFRVSGIEEVISTYRNMCVLVE